MYLREIRIVNDGPNEDVSISLPLGDQGTPKPLVVVGENGSGKSNLLSIIADALVEGAAQHHSDVVPRSGGTDRPWMRIVGGTTLRRGTQGGFALLHFTHDNGPLIYAEKAGHYPTTDLPMDLTPELKEGATWSDAGPAKTFKLSEEQSRQIYSSGCYAFFPASRSEVPHWLNGESLPSKPFSTAVRFSGRLGKPLYVEQGIESLSQWIPGLIMDSRPTVARAPGPPNSNQWTLTSTSFQMHLSSRELADRVLRVILDDPEAGFVWVNRFTGLEYFSPKAAARLPLAALSSGQATLLSIFGTILRQCDAASNGDPTSASGICVIDEIDAHVHVDLTYRAIPELMAMFTGIQFITSAHSPLLVLGMQSKFGDDHMLVTEMPFGRSVTAEGYREFKNALDVLRSTQGFDSLVIERLNSQSSPLILCEGETDPKYIETAMELLGEGAILSGITTDWIGMRSKSTGGSIGAGKDNLHRAWQLLTANPELTGRPVMLLYDNDAKKPDVDEGRISVRTLPTNPENVYVRNGIENLLTPNVFLPDMFSEHTHDDGNGKTVTIRELNKSALCARLCDERRDASNFLGFNAVVEIIREWRERLGLDAKPASSADSERPTGDPEVGTEPAER
ncbi:AAA domain-containing protein, putative AbiEii toxin, Type IV TA system [Tessaracoccus bendigoensis DSM 12906]|uniref:AAA domain-containing protein, putative AbiEii toxin, Type IV TA system n=1 Tax=Tessaracoccus bendigoensis DSM 12906 TaxID=1123357 RepID=A0A1M6EBL3_9ACTN|nr:AAA family ATPase [Tessaracoccus bendigoensis]SHI82886.1 AAA domain-containing protein, putative AbiEii toxin, Type IV TA system [Tessaracoccus bendigoensis DSM 12906]